MTDRAPPSTASIALATGILAALLGYFVGQGSSLGLFSSRDSARRPARKSWPNSYDVNVHADSSDEELMRGLRGEKGEEGSEDDDEEEEEEKDRRGDGSLSAFEGYADECKLVLVVRTDLGMTKGKMAAQCCHATLSNYKSLSAARSCAPLLRRWESTGQAKVALQVGSGAELEALRARAAALGLCARVVMDAGRTQIEAGSVTVCGIGPGPKRVVDEVTGGLRLL